MTTHRRTVAGHPRELSAVRGWVRKLLTNHPRAEEAELIVSELSTNAFRHTESGSRTGTFEVALTLAQRGVAITVTDQGTSTSSPRIQRPADDSTRGRGLDIVSTLADRFTISGDHRGRAVTAELWLPRQGQPSASESASSIAQHGYRCEHHVQSPADEKGPHLVNTFSTGNAEAAIRWIRQSVRALHLGIDAAELDRLRQWAETDHAKALDDLRRSLPSTLITGNSDDYHQWTARPVIFLPLLPPPGKPVLTYQPMCSRARRCSAFE
ncbi:ATP-binding protein [Kitasatospora sp. RB6PN24]|uniref:ATP-binding protein n=1 Tax=Kitasatospora humi TaxID=2893891 RepID=UPI001E522F9E|nr:ATP-binding protein [Kitasatospora humi]MCC9311709.1 ATP-binding protein [Kitasatospora humi]